MKKILLAGLVAFVLIGVSGMAAAQDPNWWYVDVEADVINATAIIFGAGGSDVPGECLSCDQCNGDGCASTLAYYLQSGAGIANGYGSADLWGMGTNGPGLMFTSVSGTGDWVFANQQLDAVVCQDCCPEGEYYGAYTSVDVKEGGVSAYLEQGTEQTGPYTDYWPTTGQIVHANGGAEGTIDVHMTANLNGETHTMGIYGENVDGFNAFAYQGMEYTDSTAYGAFWPTENGFWWGETPLMYYGDFWGDY